MQFMAVGLDREDIRYHLEGKGWTAREIDAATDVAIGTGFYNDSRVQILFDEESATFVLIITGR